MRQLILLSIILSLSSAAALAQCNGSEILCDRPYDQTAFLCTHNGYNTEEDGFALPNHTHGIAKQLEDGVRAFMFDIYDEGGVITQYHGFAALGTAPLADALVIIRDFLVANETEIVTIIFESYVSAAQTIPDFDTLGLIPLLYSLPETGVWPTLGEMVDANERLVVLSDRNDADSSQTWHHYVWDHAVETPFSNHDTSDFECVFNRGDSANALFILNHFLTDQNLGVGQTDQSLLANDSSFMMRRIRQCRDVMGKFPNFVTVDFYELGQTKAVVDALNGVSAASTGVEQPNACHIELVVYGSSLHSFCGNQSIEVDQLRLYDAMGRLVAVFENPESAFPIFELSRGIYIAQAELGSKTESVTIAID